MKKLKAQELRTIIPTSEEIAKIKRNDIYIILDNVLDTYNIGAIFRLADAVAAKNVYLCGETETPPNSRIKKASINTTEWIPWEYRPNAKSAIEDLRFKIKEVRIVAIEQNRESTPYDVFDYSLPLALVVGNETHGISKEALSIVDIIVELPIFGINKSLNVMVSLGIVLYQVIERNQMAGATWKVTEQVPSR